MRLARFSVRRRAELQLRLAGGSKEPPYAAQSKSAALSLVLGTVILSAILSVQLYAGTGAGAEGPWFGLVLPGGAGPAVQVGPRPPRPVVLPAGEPPAAGVRRQRDQARRRDPGAVRRGQP